jgi:hypothetical protein
MGHSQWYYELDGYITDQSFIAAISEIEPRYIRCIGLRACSFGNSVRREHFADFWIWHGRYKQSQDTKILKDGIRSKSDILGRLLANNYHESNQLRTERKRQSMLKVTFNRAWGRYMF